MLTIEPATVTGNPKSKHNYSLTVTQSSLEQPALKVLATDMYDKLITTISDNTAVDHLNL